MHMQKFWKQSTKNRYTDKSADTEAQIKQLLKKFFKIWEHFKNNRESYMLELLELPDRIKGNKLVEINSEGKVDLSICHLHEVVLYALKHSSKLTNLFNDQSVREYILYVEGFLEKHPFGIPANIQTLLQVMEMENLERFRSLYQKPKQLKPESGITLFMHRKVSEALSLLNQGKNFQTLQPQFISLDLTSFLKALYSLSGDQYKKLFQFLNYKQEKQQLQSSVQEHSSWGRPFQSDSEEEKKQKPKPISIRNMIATVDSQRNRGRLNVRWEDQNQMKEKKNGIYQQDQAVNAVGQSKKAIPYKLSPCQAATEESKKKKQVKQSELVEQEESSLSLGGLSSNPQKFGKLGQKKQKKTGNNLKNFADAFKRLGEEDDELGYEASDLSSISQDFRQKQKKKLIEISLKAKNDGSSKQNLTRRRYLEGEKRPPKPQSQRQMKNK